MKSRLKKQLSMILLATLLSTSGCSNNTPTAASPSAKTPVITYTEEDSSYVNTDSNIIYINNYEEYKNYLSELNPSYELLRETVKNNPNITGNYESALLQIVDIFEASNINTSKLAIFYENVKKEVINTEYSIDKNQDSFVGAFFTPDPDAPSITVDGENVDFYAFLHEVIHSCHEVKIRVGDKIIYITGLGLEKELNEKGEEVIKKYGIGFIEGQAEFISAYLYKSSKHLFESDINYNNANDIIDFLYDTQSIDFNDFFLLNTNDFKKILLDLNIDEEIVDRIIAGLDYQVRNDDANGFETRELFYTNYIPKLVREYIETEYSSKKIYSIIGESLKTSVIEKNQTINDLGYYKDYLNDQKRLFDNIDEIIASILNDHNMDVYSIYDFIGHEFEIYYSLYGDEASLDYENLYFAHNWDNKASESSNIIIYVEDDSIKMCNYAKNGDGTLTCYDYNGEIKDINNGVRLGYLTEREIVTVNEGYLRYYYYTDILKDAIRDTKITSTYNVNSMINNSFLYLSENDLIIGSYSINEEGEEIPYVISDSKVYVLPENAITIGPLKELSEEGVMTFDENGHYEINSEKLNEYIKDKRITYKRR